jgi:hypothetical protein
MWPLGVAAIIIFKQPDCDLTVMVDMKNEI